MTSPPAPNNDPFMRKGNAYFEISELEGLDQIKRHRQYDIAFLPEKMLSSLPNLVQNNLKSSNFAYFCQLVNHLFGLKSRTTVIIVSVCDERLFLTSEVNGPCAFSFIS